jgi:hypothetical protein
VIAIDGKTLRQSYDKGNGKGAIQMVSAWATANRLVPGQCKVESKSNEITAIPKLLKMLEVKGCIVTIDAMGTQTRIAQQIVEREGDYETRYYISSLTSDAQKLSQSVVIG